jgi:mono/diheme cytochrome c family protein
MKNRVLLVGLIPVLALACGTSVDSEYETAVLVLPNGEPEAGRQAFIDLGCSACHRVSWETDMPGPVSPVPAPDLGIEHAQRSAGWIATAIIVPSHNVPAEMRAATEDDHSPMGDYTETMTVRQLADVVAYLRAAGGNKQARM